MQTAQYVINAISLGGTYALLALGLAIVFSVFRLINFAHGELITISGYALLAATNLGLPFVPAAVVAVLAAGAVAALMERIAFRPLRGASVETLFVASLAISIILQIAFQDLISARAKPVDVPPVLSHNVSIGGLDIGVVQLTSCATTVVALLAVSLLLNRTVIGTSMRAAAADFPTARLMGIRAGRVTALAFVLSGLLAGIAGVLLVAQRGSVTPTLGTAPVLAAFVGTVLGGLGSLRGAVIGGFAFGVIVTALQSYLPSEILPYRDAIGFALVIALIMLRPHGLAKDPSVTLERA